MGFFRKLAFWKKDDLDFGMDDPFKTSLGANDPLGKDIGATQPGSDPLGSMKQDPIGGMNAPSFGAPPSSPTGYSSFSQPVPQQGASPEIEVISAKLDAIKATMDSINQRLTNIERIANAEQEEKPRW